MKTKAEVLRILQNHKPELMRRYGLTRLALFGSYAREDQRDDSDVDVLVEIEPAIGLDFVELTEEIEHALGMRTDVISRRAIKPRYWQMIKEELVDVPWGNTTSHRGYLGSDRENRTLGIRNESQGLCQRR